MTSSVKVKTHLNVQNELSLSVAQSHVLVKHTHFLFFWVWEFLHFINIHAHESIFGEYKAIVKKLQQIDHDVLSAVCKITPCFTRQGLHMQARLTMNFLYRGQFSYSQSYWCRLLRSWIRGMVFHATIYIFSMWHFQWNFNIFIHYKFGGENSVYVTCTLISRWNCLRWHWKWSSQLYSTK